MMNLAIALVVGFFIHNATWWFAALLVGFILAVDTISSALQTRLTARHVRQAMKEFETQLWGVGSIRRTAFVSTVIQFGILTLAILITSWVRRQFF